MWLRLFTRFLRRFKGLNVFLLLCTPFKPSICVFLRLFIRVFLRPRGIRAPSPVFAQSLAALSNVAL
jgi:hypothetical protein